MGTWSPKSSATPNSDQYTGTSSNETADGLGGNDTLDGYGGNDHLYGNDGNDALTGGPGNDILEGGDGNDNIFDSDGNDTIYGGAGDDTISELDLYDPIGDTVYIDAGADNDLIEVSTAVHHGVFVGGSGYDRLQFSVAEGHYGITLANFAISGVEQLISTAALYGRADRFGLFDAIRYSQDDATLGNQVTLVLVDQGTFDLSSKLGPQAAYVEVSTPGSVVTTGDGNDWLTTTYFLASTITSFDAGGGNDRLDGGVGRDSLVGGEGNDAISGMSGNDDIYGGQGDDSIDGGAGDDYISAGGGNDVISVLDSGSPAIQNGDYILCGAGNDIVYADVPDTDGNGISIVAEAGDDTVYVGNLPSGGADGGEGTDRLSLYRKPNGVDPSGTHLEKMAISNFEILLTGDHMGFGKSAQFESFDSIRFSDDPASLSTYVNLTLSEAGTLDLSDNLGGQFVSITASVAGNNILTGEGDDVLNGVGGNDTLNAGGGNDTVNGGDGADDLQGGAGIDVLDGGEGVDTANYAAAKTAVLLSLNGENSVVARLDGKTDDTFRNFENVSGGSARDNLTGDGLANMLAGNDGNDMLSGRDGLDALDGGKGNDTADFSDKDTNVYVALNKGINVTAKVGGVDEDTLRNIENVIGGVAADKLTGDGLGNIFAGGEGSDVIDGGVGFDTADYSEKTNAVVVTLRKGAFANVKIGGVNEDKIKNIEAVCGGSASDKLTGDNFANSLIGGHGNDRLNGSGGADDLYGGSGKDVFLFKSISDSGQGVSDRDTIFDFSVRDDHVDISGIDANGKASGNGQFQFIGTHTFTKAAGELRYEKSASGSVVYGDINGDGKSDFAVHFDDAIKLHLDDFVL